MTDDTPSRLSRSMPTVLRRLVRAGTLNADIEGLDVRIMGPQPGLDASITFHDADAFRPFIFEPAP